MVKNYDIMLRRFHLIPECYGQTDRFSISISRVDLVSLRNVKSEEQAGVSDVRLFHACTVSIVLNQIPAWYFCITQCACLPANYHWYSLHTSQRDGQAELT